MNIHTNKWCHFCDKNSKLIDDMISREGMVCVNGHYIITDEVKEIVPKSEGTNIVSNNTYRKNSSWGYFCNRDGERI